VTRESITRDLEGMKARGFGGVMVVDAGGAEQGGNQQVPAGLCSAVRRGASCSTMHWLRRSGSASKSA